MNAVFIRRFGGIAQFPSFAVIGIGFYIFIDGAVFISFINFFFKLALAVVRTKICYLFNTAVGIFPLRYDGSLVAFAVMLCIFLLFSYDFTKEYRPGFFPNEYFQEKEDGGSSGDGDVF